MVRFLVLAQSSSVSICNSYPRLTGPHSSNWVVLSRRLLKQLEKPTSLDLTFTPPTIMVTANMSEADSDVESISPAVPKPSGNNLLGVPPSGMCYLSPFSIVARNERTTSESNLSSSGYSSMASPGPSRCGSSNPLCASEAEDPSNGREEITG